MRSEHACGYVSGSLLARRSSLRAPLLVWLLLLTPAVSWGVAEWHGRPDEYVPIENGIAPNRQLAIAAHEDQTGRFGLFLQNRATQRSIKEVAIVLEPVDTAPEAFHAEWAPDSHHVAIWHRIDTRLNQLVIYRVDIQDAHSVTGESLLRVLSPELGAVENKIDTGFQSLKWMSSERFLMHADGQLPKPKTKGAVRLIFGFGRIDPAKPDMVKFSIDGECELTQDDRYRVLRITPGKL